MNDSFRVLLRILVVGLAWQISCEICLGQNDVTTDTTISTTSRSKEEYIQWVTRQSEPRSGGARAKEYRLVLMAVEGEVGTLEPESNLFGAKLVQYGTLISRDGTVSHFSHSARGTKGSGGERMRPEQLQQLDKLLSKLPEDGARLPVADRRLFVEKTDGSGQSIARVYDRADLPDEILSIAKFCQAAIGVWIPEFKAETEIDARQFEHGGFFCLSPDGKQLILTSANGPIQFWDPLTHKSLGEIQPVQGTPLDGIAYSPDGTQAALFGRGECALVDTKKWQRIKSFAGPLIDRTRIQFSEPRFTPDGKYLTLQSSEPPLRVHKASTWEQVTNVPDVQENGSSDYLGG